MGQTTSPEQAWQRLTQRTTGSAKTAATTTDAAPLAVVFGCSDARGGVESAFGADRLGELLIVQTAGHTVGSAVLGTIEFAVWALGAPLVIVLGHDSCSALSLSDDFHMTGRMPQGHIREIVTAAAVEQTAQLICDRSRIVTSAVATGRLAIISATYRPTGDELQVRSVVGPVSPSSPGPGHVCLEG